jgi:hypothetical protein
MRNKTRFSKSAMTVLAAVVSSMIASAYGAAQVIPPGDADSATGMTYNEWSAAWWQYALSKSAKDPNNPLLDATGRGCDAEQSRSSPVFFLSGWAGSGTVTRDECTVPADKALFFPLMNAFDLHVPGDAIPTAELARQELLSFWGPITALHASVDGEPIGVDLFTFDTCAGGDPACSASFSVTLPGNNVVGLRGGIYSPAVAVGYYLMLAPLPAGPHTISFGGQGQFGGAPFSQDITYHLVVK